MNPTYRLASLAGALMTGGMLLGSAASAQVADCPATQSLADFLDNPCRSQDKLYTSNAAMTTIPSDQIVITLDIIQGQDVHRLSYNRTQEIPDGSYTLAYSIEIVDDPTTPEDETTFRSFDQVSLGVDVPGQTPGVTVEKEIATGGYGVNVLDTLVSVDGDEPPPYVCDACESTLYIVDRVTIEGGTFSSFTNTFTQSGAVVPAPATLGIFGLGLAALGMVGVRRRKRSA